MVTAGLLLLGLSLVEPGKVRLKVILKVRQCVILKLPLAGCLARETRVLSLRMRIDVGSEAIIRHWLARFWVIVILGLC